MKQVGIIESPDCRRLKAAAIDRNEARILPATCRGPRVPVQARILCVGFPFSACYDSAYFLRQDSKKKSVLFAANIAGE